MQLFYGTQITRQSINQIISNTQQAIKIKSLCKAVLPQKCHLQTDKILAQTINNLVQQSSTKSQIQKQYRINSNIKTDNRTPLKVSIEKRIPQANQQRLKLMSGKSFRKSTSFKSRRDQQTASTNRKRLSILNKTNDGSFLQEMNVDGCLCDRKSKRLSRTADASRPKYLQLKDQILFTTQLDEDLIRKDLRQKRTLQKIQIQKKQNQQIKLSYHKRQLKQQLQLAKIGQKGFTVQKNKQPNQIINYETQNGIVFTNQHKKPYRKTIQNIIKLEYDQKVKQRIHKRKTQRQFQVEKNGKKTDENTQILDRQRFVLKNREYNNGQNRQISLIPYLTINPGVCLSQRSIQASISRAPPSQILSRQKYLKSIQNRNYKLFHNRASLDVNMNSRTVDVCQKNRESKSSLFQHQTKDSLRRSILWGPKTARQGNKIKLVREDFMKQLLIQGF